MFVFIGVLSSLKRVSRNCRNSDTFGIGEHLRSERAKILRQPLDDRRHRLPAVLLVLIAAFVKPLALVVALERTEE